MLKQIALPEKVYDDLVAVSEELTLMAKKPVSLPMAIDLIIEVYHAYLNNPCALDAFSQQLASLNLMSPEEFEKTLDEMPKKKKKTVKKLGL